MFRVEKGIFYEVPFNGYEIEKLYNSVANSPTVKYSILGEFETEEKAIAFYKEEKKKIKETTINKQNRRCYDGEIIILVDVDEDGIFKGNDLEIIKQYINCPFAIE